MIKRSFASQDVLQSQTCSSDYVIIPYPNQNNALMPSDRFCGLGFVETTSKYKLNLFDEILCVPIN